MADALTLAVHAVRQRSPFRPSAKDGARSPGVAESKNRAKLPELPKGVVLIGITPEEYLAQKMRDEKRKNFRKPDPTNTLDVL